MDAVPGLPTHFVFTPTVTTAEYRQRLKDYPEYQVPADPSEPDGPQRWEEFNYELACAELCGKGHYSMRRIVEIVDQDTYEKWHSEQNSYYMANIRNTDADPFKGQLLDPEISARVSEIKSEYAEAIAADGPSSIRLKNVFFETGSAALQDQSKWELNEWANLLKAQNNVKVELAGHTDSQGDDAMNLALSQSRAESVLNYLNRKGVSLSNMSSKGYGENNPVESNDTAEGRQANRRTELKIISK